MMFHAFRRTHRNALRTRFGRVGLPLLAVVAALTPALAPGRASADISLGGWIQHSPDDITGFTSLTGDNNVASATMPFSITIEGTSYNTVAISTNGWLEFGGNTGSGGTSSPTNSCLPTSTHTNPLLAAYWDDLNPFGTNVRYGTVGTSPDRTFIVDYQVDVDPANEAGGSDDTSFQVQVHERSNVIIVRYHDQGDVANGQSATIGFQGAGGSSGNAQPITCNGKVLDDNLDNEGWSADVGRAGNVVLGALIQHSPDDIPGGFTSLTGNDATATPTIPFNVNIEGTNYNTVTISTNGWLEFGGNTSGNSNPSNTCLPVSNHTNPFMPFYWDDMQTINTAIRYGTVGTSPNRTFIVDFDIETVDGSDNGSDDVTGQVQIHERSNLINVRYTTAQSSVNGQNATIGFQGAGGSSANAYPLTCNGKILDDNQTESEGWSVHSRSLGAMSIHGAMAHSPDDIPGGFTTLSGNDVVNTATIPFNVRIDGVNYNTVAISTNGWMEFGGNTGAGGTSSPTNACLPTSTHTNPFLAGFWDDMQTANTHIRYGTVGTSPDRTFVVDFFLDTVTSSDDGADDAVFGVEVHERSNLISVKYRTTQLHASGTTATIGYQGAGGSSATAHPLTCNGRVLDDNRPNQGWSVAPLPLCGNSIIETAEDCDAGGANGTLASCCSSTCGFKTNGTACTDDGNGCTNDTCNGNSATCQHPNNTAPCTDGLFCNGTDTCSGGSCSSHAGDPCVGPDGDGNCSESCSEAADNCLAADPNGSSCTDGLFCTGTDTCSGGTCSSHTGDPCMGGGDCADVCDEGIDTCNEPLGTGCNTDGNGCTDDFCNGSGSCVHPANSAPCDDGSFCNGTDTCAGGGCSVHTGDPCPGADGDADCSESCDEGADNCLAADTDGSSCTDGLFCNGADTCSSGACTTHAGDPCTGGGECADSCDEGTDDCNEDAGTPCFDDSNVCTDDACDGSGDCAHTNNTDPCDDSLFCNGTDTCAGGTCGHSGDPCPGPNGDANCNESCDESADDCTAADPDASACDDSVFCNGADSCESGACTGHAGDPCPGPNGDANCSESCDENADDCTAADPDASTCDDSVFCNGADSCASGACTTHAGDPCPGPDGDGNCSESCDESADDCTAADADTSACDDDVFCNGADTCDTGACTTHAGDPCLSGTECADACDEDADGCNDPSGTTCADDSNGCTDDECDGAGICAHPANTAACDDGLFCNGTDTCDATTCSVHTGDPCTGGADCSDACNEGAEDCNDLMGAACVDDGNPCTDDICDGTGGCTHPDNTAPCDDGDSCTVNDTCGGGACVSGPAADCDDGSPCTDDSCDSGTGCVNEAAPFDESLCFTAAKASFQIKERTGTADDQIKWKRGRGEGYSQAKLGHPSTTATYTLCVYDTTGGVPSLVGSLTVPPNASWVDKSPKGWSYINKAAPFDGVTKLLLVAGIPEKAKMQLIARGSTASWPAPLNETTFFDLDTEVIVQLSNDETGDCWSTTFDQAKKNEGTQFKTKFAP